MLKEIVQTVKDLLKDEAGKPLADKIDNYYGEFEQEGFAWDPGKKNILVELESTESNVKASGNYILKNKFTVNLYCGCQVLEESEENISSVELAELVYNIFDGINRTIDGESFNISAESIRIKAYHTGIPVYQIQITLQ